MRAGGGLRDALPARTRMNYRAGIQRIPLAIEAMEVPLTAAVNGPAIGAGCGLACMCDIRIAANPAHAIRMTRRRLRQSRNAELAAVLDMSAAMQALAHETADHAEAVDAMLEKRKPRFTGS